MRDENTQLNDLTEMERLVIGSSINFVYNILNSQIYHIEHHDPELAEILHSNEDVQEDYILLKSCREITNNLVELFGNTFSQMSYEELMILSKPGMKLDNFFKDICKTISCNDNN